MLPSNVLKKVRAETDSVLLFHSATGKDSIVLIDMCSKAFTHVHCVFMYVVDDLSYNQKYIKYFENRYPNVTFYSTPHYGLYSYIRAGALGIKKEAIPNRSLSYIIDMWRAKLGVQYCVLGMKKKDSLKRYIMLKDGLEGDAIQWKTKKVYPLTDWSNKSCLAYIKQHKLPHPMAYSKDASNGDVIDDVNYLLWLRANYPSDLQKVFAVFPLTKQILFEYDHKAKTKI